MARHDWPRVRAACHVLLLDASHRIAALSGLPQLSPDTPDWWVQMRTLPLKRSLEIESPPHVGGAFTAKIMKRP